MTMYDGTMSVRTRPAATFPNGFLMTHLICVDCLHVTKLLRHVEVSLDTIATKHLTSQTNNLTGQRRQQQQQRRRFDPDGSSNANYTRHTVSEVMPLLRITIAQVTALPACNNDKNINEQVQCCSGGVVATVSSMVSLCVCFNAVQIKRSAAAPLTHARQIVVICPSIACNKQQMLFTTSTAHNIC
eukprot:GHRR01009668.1.p1 GENE.GHRR01009668.1~~GHRR01009668.1.p1  ORF type:complete len:186 (-),score=41.26 GHRR01009668.1:1858-2415(-)